MTLRDNDLMVVGKKYLGWELRHVPIYYLEWMVEVHLEDGWASKYDDFNDALDVYLEKRKSGSEEKEIIKTADSPQ